MRKLLSKLLSPFKRRVRNVAAEVAKEELSRTKRELAGFASPNLWLNRELDFDTPDEQGSALEEFEKQLGEVGGDYRRFVAEKFSEDNPLVSEQLAKLEADEVKEYLRKDPRPIPHFWSREGYGGSELYYWLWGLADALIIKNHWDFEPGKGRKFFEFGAASGRVSRHFTYLTPEMDVLCCDLNVRHVKWVEKNFGDELISFVNTSLPSLPLLSETIDSIYAGSVFSHADHFETSWLMEMHRILKPGGTAIFTTHTERSWDPTWESLVDNLNGQFNYSEELGGEIDATVLDKPMPEPRVVFKDRDSPAYNTHSFQHTDYIKKRWGRIFEVTKFEECAHGRYQDAVFLRKR